MYKGNMYEFVGRITNFVKDVYGMNLKLEQSDEWEIDRFKRQVEKKPRDWVRTGKKCLILWHYDSSVHGRHGIGQTLYDRQDFEDQVYKFVNERLEKMKQNEQVRVDRGTK